MAPNRGSSGKKSSSSASLKKGKMPTLSSRITKSSKKKNAKLPSPQEAKSKARTAPDQLKKTKKREYTAEELDLLALNTITPVGVLKPKGQKNGKVFVDDQEAMMTILSMVNAEQEGRIESKIMKARQLEEIREAKMKEAEARQAQKKSKLEDARESIRNKRKRKGTGRQSSESASTTAPTTASSSKHPGKRKSVSFA